MSQPKCAICSKPAEAKFAPFCSQRCADVDLSRWLKGSYVIPGKPAGEEDEGEESPRNRPENRSEPDED